MRSRVRSVEARAVGERLERENRWGPRQRNGGASVCLDVHLAAIGGGFTGRLRLMSLAIDRIRESWKLGHDFAMRLPNGLALR